MEKRLGLTLGFALLASLPAAKASAEGITFAIIGPHEYELPVNFKDFDAFVQYGEANASNQYYTPHGGLAPEENQDTAVGFTKLVRFITFDGLPNVGFAPEAIIPEIATNMGGGLDYATGKTVKPTDNEYGIVDPVFGGATWIKPNKDSTFGFQAFIEPPIGTHYGTNHDYNYIATILYDYQFKGWDIDGDTGGQFTTTQHIPGMAPTNIGDQFFENLRVGFKVLPSSIPIEPFAALDYQYQLASHNALTGQLNPNSASQDLALGAGGVITINDKYSLTLRYSRSVYGINEVPTNAVYMKFVSILP